MDLNKLIEEHADLLSRVHEDVRGKPWEIYEKNKQEGGVLNGPNISLAEFAVNNIGPLLEHAIVQSVLADELSENPDSVTMKENLAMKKFILEVVGFLKEEKVNSILRIRVSKALDECAYWVGGAVPKKEPKKRMLSVKCPSCGGRGSIQNFNKLGKCVGQTPCDACKCTGLKIVETVDVVKADHLYAKQETCVKCNGSRRYKLSVFGHQTRDDDPNGVWTNCECSMRPISRDEHI